MAGAFDAQGGGAIVNNSRGIIFAHAREPVRRAFRRARWQEAVEAATRDMIEQLRAETPAGEAWIKSDPPLFSLAASPPLAISQRQAETPRFVAKPQADVKHNDVLP